MTNDKINFAIASDHGGFELKNKIIDYLKSKSYDVKDFGTFDKNSCDYPVYAKYVANAVLSREFKKGILVCGTGIGMQIAANRFKGIRAVCPSNSYYARLSVEHNNSNILCLGQRALGEDLATEILETWINSKFQGGRHQRRIDMIDE